MSLTLLVLGFAVIVLLYLGFYREDMGVADEDGQSDLVPLISEPSVTTSVVQTPQEEENAEIVQKNGKEYVFIKGFGGIWLPIMNDVPKNTYLSKRFRVDDSNFLEYTDEEGLSVSHTGIDVSSYQGEINWNILPEQGIEFAMIRLGYRGYSAGGKIMLDEKFYENVEGALAAGLEVGVYFFSQAVSVEEAIEEAEFVLEEIESYDITYPVVFDWELIEGENSARTVEVSAEELNRMAMAFCERIDNAGYTPMYYADKAYALLKYDPLQMNKYDLWLADYSYDLQYSYKFGMWQYGTAELEGIDEPVSLNIKIID